jgi:hypothetical protein
LTFERSGLRRVWPVRACDARSRSLYNFLQGPSLEPAPSLIHLIPEQTDSAMTVTFEGNGQAPPSQSLLTTPPSMRALASEKVTHFYVSDLRAGGRNEAGTTRCVIPVFSQEVQGTLRDGFGHGAAFQLGRARRHRYDGARTSSIPRATFLHGQSPLSYRQRRECPGGRINAKL